MRWHERAPELVFAYARVSSADQNPGRQTELFRGLDPDHVCVDHASGSSTDRSELRELRKVLRRGDTLVAKSPECLARNTVDLLNIAHELRDKGVGLEFLDTPALNVDSATGEFMLAICAGFATPERAHDPRAAGRGHRSRQGTRQI